MPVPMRRPWLVRAPAAAASVAACTAIGLGVWASDALALARPCRASSASAAQAAQVLADPSSQKIALRGGNGMLAVDPAGRGVLVVAAAARGAVRPDVRGLGDPAGRQAAARPASSAAAGRRRW